MTSPADPAIEALAAVRDDVAERVRGYTDAELVRPSGAAEWTVAQVLSHLGSGAEIARAGLEAALAGGPAPDQSFNESVWDRWNGMTPREQADGFLTSDAALVAGYAGLDDATRDGVRFTLAFLPEPVGLDVVTAMRLNESALHAWDVAVADDPTMAVNRAAVPVLVDAYTGPLSFLIGFIARGVEPGGVLAVHTVEPERQLTLRVGGQVSVHPSAPDKPEGTVTLPGEALLRLLTGRLGPDHTPDAVTVTGSMDLAALRAVFPGF